MGFAKKAFGWGSAALTLWWLYQLGGETPAAPDTPASAPAASAPAVQSHRMTMPEIRGLMQAGGATTGNAIYGFTLDDVCAAALRNQAAFGGGASGTAPVPQQDAACASRNGELDLALLLAGHVIGRGLTETMTDSDVCGAFGVAVLRADLKDAKKSGLPPTPEPGVVTHLNQTFQSCTANHGAAWNVPVPVWETLSDALIFRALYPVAKP